MEKRFRKPGKNDWTKEEYQMVGNHFVKFLSEEEGYEKVTNLLKKILTDKQRETLLSKRTDKAILWAITRFRTLHRGYFSKNIKGTNSGGIQETVYLELNNAMEIQASEEKIRINKEEKRKNRAKK